LQIRQVSAVIVIVGIICLALGVAIGYGLNSGKTTTTSVLQSSIVTETQTMTTVEKVNVTVTPYCCIDVNINSGIPCSEMVTPDSAIQTLEDRIETDPTYIAAEQGTEYTSLYGMGCGSGFSVGGTTPNGTILYFQSSYAIDRLYTDDCGDVGNFTYYLNVDVLLTATGYNMSAIQISPINSSEITISCSSTITTENTTVTITPTTSE
jgi:hypothetical protein